MPNLIAIENQEAIERKYNRKHIDGYIRECLAGNPDVQAKVDQGVELLQEWMVKDYYASKNHRLSQLHSLDLFALVNDIFVGIAYIQQEALLASVCAQLASRLKFSDRVAGVTTLAEILAVLCITDAFDINKASRSDSLVVISRLPLTNELLSFIEHSAYLPPMVCVPKTVETNYCSGYLTHNDSLVLGKGNHHDGDLCLDVINTVNQVALKLDTDFLSTVDEEPTFEITTQDQLDQWNNYKAQSYGFYALMVNHGNRFHLTNKVDKRGRLYVCGYHISTQSTSYKKAMIELANEEIIEGVPESCQI